MLKRKALAELERWKAEGPRTAMLVTGARQVGKTYLVREFGRANYDHFVEINLLESEDAREAFAGARNSRDLFSRMTLYADDELVPGRTLVFIDEVQAAPETVTAIKFLIERTGADYDYVLSGSMLGTELEGIRSWPVGFMRILDMRPLDFEEFCWAAGLPEDAFGLARGSFARNEPLDEFVHRRLMDLFYYYLAVGGMPQAVDEYVRTGNLQATRSVQEDILRLYRRDITQYCRDDALFVKAVFDLIPAQLNKQNKRFVVSEVDGRARLSRTENRFLWLSDAGVALPSYNVEEPRYPLLLSVKSSLFKLYMSDVGLLACASGMDVVRKTVNREPANYGAVYENFVAQELACRGRRLFYYKGKKLGELDFVLEQPGGSVLPVEVKSGKDYRRHRALDNVLAVSEYGIGRGVVLHDGNVSAEGKVSYLPIYMAGLL